MGLVERNLKGDEYVMSEDISGNEENISGVCNISAEDLNEGNTPNCSPGDVVTVIGSVNLNDTGWKALGNIQVEFHLVLNNGQKEILSNTISNYDSGNNYLLSINAPAITYIDKGALRKCKSLTSVSLPAVKNIRKRSFAYCESLTDVSFPAVTEVDDLAFYGCTSLRSISLPAATCINGEAFHDCINLTSVSLPAAETIRSQAFRNCKNLTNISYPASTDIHDNAFYGCKKSTSRFVEGAVKLGEDISVKNPDPEIIACGFSAPRADTSIEVGGKIEFGAYSWRVLDIQNSKALILSEKTVECRRYHDRSEEITWELCTLRGYLNEEFYNKFNAEEKTRISETRIINNDNPWFETDGGDVTNDKIFLLSIEEVVKYFGDSGKLAQQRIKNLNSYYYKGYNASYFNLYYIDDKYNFARKAVNTNGGDAWWTLRSPGRYNYDIAYVSYDGKLNVHGGSICQFNGYIRPALWLNL